MTHLDEILLVCGCDGRIRSCTGPVAQLVGDEREAICGRCWTDLFQNDAAGMAAAAMEQLKSGTSERAQFRVSVSDGLPEAIWSCSRPDPAADLVIVVGRTDVTPSTPDNTGERPNGRVVYEWDVTADVVVWSGSCEDVLGYSAGELPTSLAGWLELIHPDDRYGAGRGHAGGRTEPLTTRFIYRVQKADGSWALVQDLASFIADRNGRPVRMRGTLRTIPRERSGGEELPDDASPAATSSDASTANDLLQLIVDSTPTGILAVDGEGRIRLSNPHLQQTFGYTARELEGEPVELLLPERLRERHRALRESWQKAPLSRPMGSGLPLVGQRSDGIEIPIDISLEPVRTSAGMLVLCTVADRTERMAAERAILESDRRLNDIIDNTSAVIYLKSLDGRYLLVNRQWEILFDIDRQTMINKTDHDVFPEDLAIAFRENDELVAESGRLHEFEEIAPHADGPHTYISLKFPLRRSDGTIYGVAGISTDITERIEAERAHSALKHRLELIVNSIGDGLYGVDCDGKITFANSAAERMLGRGTGELCGRDPHAVLHDASHDAGNLDDDDSCHVCDASQAGVQTGIEEDLFCRGDGTTFPVEYTSTPVFDEGKRVGSVVTFRDISERIRRERAEEELRTAQAVQQLLYPRSSPTLDGVDIAGATFPAAMACGDYFDFIRTGQDELVLALGDVSGHGLGPALQMVEARAYLRATINGDSDEQQVLTRLNSLLYEDMPVESFLTLILARIDARSRRFRYAGAGHNAYLMRPDGEIEDLPSTGLVLGLVDQVELTISEPVTSCSCSVTDCRRRCRPSPYCSAWTVRWTLSARIGTGRLRRFSNASTARRASSPATTLPKTMSRWSSHGSCRAEADPAVTVTCGGTVPANVGRHQSVIESGSR